MSNVIRALSRLKGLRHVSAVKARYNLRAELGGSCSFRVSVDEANPWPNVTLWLTDGPIEFATSMNRDHALALGRALEAGAESIQELPDYSPATREAS